MNTFDCDEFQVQTLESFNFTHDVLHSILLYYNHLQALSFTQEGKQMYGRFVPSYYIHVPLQSYFSVLFVDSISSILTDSASDSAEKELSSVEDRGLISQKAFSNRT